MADAKVLREDLGFDGVLISDYSAVEELIPHGIAEDKREAARLAIEAGVDIDMMSDVYLHYLKELVTSGEVDETLVDEAVLRILKLKMILAFLRIHIRMQVRRTRKI